ncbi:hypothetical protein GGTG_08596 [Gaeumannomyces tritici R3-111a-1]|uniref:Uncharacterized protein n=1 Tax=Gaeumannomyces tritici (strain R3-111a-1) TaxID=644352 RepID=J3P510_GAET3|nr:hypothetical protein GGTG_08596 [Gaeumannomyces tritici R3-111a-1]EJT74758.1 hypothetical protein GGTG_08596 [Gaeumannomyces tritici R3-111a-1]
MYGCQLQGSPDAAKRTMLDPTLWRALPVVKIVLPPCPAECCRVHIHRSHAIGKSQRASISGSSNSAPLAQCLLPNNSQGDSGHQQPCVSPRAGSRWCQPSPGESAMPWTLPARSGDGIESPRPALALAASYPRG